MRPAPGFWLVAFVVRHLCSNIGQYDLYDLADVAPRIATVVADVARGQGGVHAAVLSASMTGAG